MTNATTWFSQIQFFTSLGFMALFFVTELGLAWVLLFFKWRARAGNSPGWTAAYRFWVRVFALTVILTLAASMPVLIQFGSLWPSLTDKIGDISGPLIAAAILTTFVFKSCFLGAMLFGQRRLSDRVHTLVVLMTAFGVTLAGFWIVVLLSWMQTPTGAVLNNGAYQVVDWLEIMLNPSVGWLAALLGVGAMLTAGFLMLGVCSRQTLRHPSGDEERVAFRTGLTLALSGVLCLAVAIPGYGRVVAEHQPAKAAATAAYWTSGAQPDLVLLAWPDTVNERNRAALTWRHAGGRWLGKDVEGNYLGLDRYSGMHAPVSITFWSFRLLLLSGLLMALVGVVTFFKARSGAFDPGRLSKGWRRLLGATTFLGWPMALAALGHVLFGLSPYAVNETITLTEITGSTRPDTLALGIVAYLVVYAILLWGFGRLLRHITLFGVVPVARRRGRA